MGLPPKTDRAAPPPNPVGPLPQEPKPQGRESAWDMQLLVRMLADLLRIRTGALRLEAEFAQSLEAIHPDHLDSARNLIHYLAVRRHDIRPLQERLAENGLSSLGRMESHVIAGIDAVLKILHHLSGVHWEVESPRRPAIDFAGGAVLLRAHTGALLGPPPPNRSVRIMVTMPSEAAHDADLVEQLVANGMDCMRVNCAHDGRDAWAGMAANLARAKRKLDRECRLLMDLAGPKLRTGPIDAATQIAKWRPQRDLHGRVTHPAQIWLTPFGRVERLPAPADGTLLVAPEILASVHTGDRLKLTDLRGKVRVLECGASSGESRWATATQTAYLKAGGILQVTHMPRHKRRTPVAGPARAGAPSLNEQFLLLRPGDPLLLTRASDPGRPATFSRDGELLEPAAIPCTLPEVFADVRPEQRIWFDDGKIGGVIESVDREQLRVRITVARPEGEKLRADKGINFPDSDIHLPALTEKDLRDLPFIAEHADLVGLSFVKRPGDVAALQSRLSELGGGSPGIMLKIETRSGFEQLPNILLTAMREPRVGVMIARGDLAVECGYERLAEVQEEILWVCEAAHVPVVWATQVLENLAKKGFPSRAEITDAAMGERAECVMLNKGPHLVEAVRALDDILRRMEAHQMKKTARLRPLRLSAAAPA